MARSRIWFSSRPCPRSSVTAITSALYFSFSHGIATDVSSPPEYARTILSIFTAFTPSEASRELRPCLELPRQRLGMAGIPRNHQYRVVAGEGAHDVFELRAVDGNRQRLRHAR